MRTILYFLMFCILVTSGVSVAQTKRALLIGIDQYAAPSSSSTPKVKPPAGQTDPSRWDVPLWHSLEGAVNDEYDSGCAQALERSERDAQARLDPESLVVGGLPVDLVVTPPVLVGHERREGARRERHRHRQVDQQHAARGAARDGAGEPRGP